MAKLMQDYIGQTQHYIVIPYFFRYGQAGCSTMDFLAVALKRLKAELNREIEPEPRLPDRQKQLVEALEEAVSKTSKKVLFLVDGLDEIYRHEREFLNVPFMAIRERIVWVCAGRSEGDLEEALKNRGAEEVFPDGLPPLDEQATRAMLIEHLGRLKYALFERDEGERNRFVEAVTRKSEGLPLYVRMVIEDLKAGQLTVWDEGKLPDGWDKYCDHLLERLRVHSAGGVLTPLVCLLAWAKEPITEGTMKVLLQPHHLANEPDWDDVFRKVLKHGHLMLQQRPTSDGESGWTIYHDSFRQHLLKSETVEPDRKWAQRRWLKVCEDWKALASQEPSLYRYILRHYAEHLLETKQYDRLWQLAQNEEFAARQREILPDEPGLSLYTLRLALDGAIQMEEPVVMSEMLLRHAKQVWGETPLQAWHRNEKKRAFMLADLVFDHDHQLGTISFLLLAWVAHLDNEAEWVETCLEKICQRWDEEDFPKLSGEPDKWEEWQGSIAVFLLGELGMVKVSVKTAQMIMDDDTKCMMVEAWTEHGFINTAIAIAREMIKKSTEERSKWLGVSGLGVIAEMLTRSQQSEYAHQVLEEALKSSKNIREAIWRSLALATVAKSLAKSGHIERAKELFNEALKVAQGIQDKIWRFLVLQKLAIILAKQGDIERTIQIFEQVIKTAEREKDIRWRLGMLKPLPVSLAKAGLIDRALEVVQSIEEIDPFGWVSSMVLCEIVEVLAEERQLDQALKVSESISDERQRFKAMVAIVEALAKLGEVNRAREIAEEIEEEKERARALASVAVALAKEGQVDQALKIINENIKELDKRCKALTMLAEALARMRQIEWAKQIFGEVLEVAGGYKKIEWSSIALKEASEIVAEAMSEAMIEAGLIDVLKVAQNMKGVERRSKALAAFAEELVKEGPTQLLLVRQIFDTLEVAENAMEAWSLVRELRKMIKAMAGSGQLAQSFELAEGLAEAIGKEQGHARALREEAISLVRQGQFDEVLKLIETIEVADERSAVMAAIAIRLSKAGHVKEAIKIAESFEQEEMRSWILASICAVLVRARETACAEEVAARIHKPDEAASAWLAISKGWAMQEELDKAEIALNKAYHFAQEGGSHWQLWRVAAAYAEIGFGDKAAALVKLLPLEREKYLPIVLDALVERGDKTNFLLLLPLCCWNLILAQRACACLAQFYPSQAKQIANLIEYG
jgi:tetratricopeptide (TPR) repeat protein